MNEIMVMIYFISKYKIYSQSCTQKKIGIFKYFKFFKSQFSGAQSVKDPPAMQETWVQSWLRRSPGGGKGNPLQYSCPEKEFQGQRSLAGYGPWGHKESDTTYTNTNSKV